MSWVQANCQRTLIKCREGGEGGVGDGENPVSRGQRYLYLHHVTKTG